MEGNQQDPRTSRGGNVYPFVGIPSFLRAPICTDLDNLDADIAVIGAPTDEGSPFLPGARLGPRGIREHSLRFGAKGYYDPQAKKTFLEYELTNGRLVDVGDASVLPTNPEDTFHNITATTEHVLAKGALPVVLGGDHAISFPVVRAYKQPLHVMHFDAHIDYSPFMHGYEFTNSHAFRHIYHMPHVESLTQIGIRSLRSRESDMGGLAERREPRGDHGGVPRAWAHRHSTGASSRRSLLREHRHRRSRYASNPRLRVGRAPTG